MSHVLGFPEIDGSMVPLVGGKAANLGVLTHCQLPVPPGFCVTTDAYRLVLSDRLDDLLAALSAATDAAKTNALAAQARERISTLPVPEELQQEIVTSYRALGSPAVAVRSSATAEDLEFASFAGQQDTFLNVVGETALLDAVRRCWASLWTDRAVSYRATNGIDQRTVALAVVVQQMVQSRAAGVMFTADPVTGTRHHTVIDASPGLGEAVVSGAVNPDRFVVDTATQTVIERKAGDKRVVVRGVAGGGTETVTRLDSSAEWALTDPQVLALSRLGQRVQTLYGAPQDTEWAIDDSDTIWLTQARPITTLYPLASPSPHPGDRVYMCLTLAQGLTRPITPMGLAAFRLIGASVAAAAGSPLTDPLAGPGPYRELGQRVFVDFTAVLRSRLGRRGALTVFGVMEARAAAVLTGLASESRFALVHRSPLWVLRPVARVLWKVRVPLRLLRAMVSPAGAQRSIAQVERSLRRELELPDDSTPEQRLDHVQRLLSSVFMLMPTIVGYPLAGFLGLLLARKALGPLAHPGDLQTVLRGLPNNVTTEMDLNLWQLTQQVRENPESSVAFSTRTVTELAEQHSRGELPTVAQDGLNAFLETYGHRAVAEIDLGMPRWSDDPSYLIGVVQNYLRLDDPALAPDAQFQRGGAEAERMIGTLVARAHKRGRLRGGLVSFGLRRTRQLAGLRETPKYLLIMALAGVRQHLGRAGASLVADGRLQNAEDIFFVDLVEARRGLAGEDLRPLVTSRRESYAQECRRRHIPRIVLSDGTEPEAVASVATRPDGALVGSPASAGTVTAQARVILDPVGAHLEPGEILVAPSTDPGWTPLFLTAGGLVMEMGGSNSHGAVVAREYGIPAVVGVPDATSKILTGQTVTVDGAAGLVVPMTVKKQGNVDLYD